MGRRACSHEPHTVDELFLAASLDDSWRTTLAIKRKFKVLGEAQKVARVLERRIEARC